MTVDRKGWPSGPWDHEPDTFAFRAHGYVCHALRQAAGHWCGYVQIPEGHPWHGKDLTGWDDDAPDPTVHGGITWSWERPHTGNDGWWIGFDCLHARDLAPAHSGPGRTYRTSEYVEAELRSLAQQVKAAA